MASLAALAKSYRKRKDEVSKLRRQGESRLKETMSTKRRSSSGLASIERKREDLTRKRDHALQLLNQHLSQRESIERLRVAAEERLRHEQDTKDQVKQQSEYGAPEDKASSVERLKYIDQKIDELHSEIKEREATQARLVKIIEASEKDKARLDRQLRILAHAKPGLVDKLRSSTKQEVVLRPRVQSLVKRETLAKKALDTLQTKLAQLAAQRRKLAKRKARTKAIARRKARAKVRKVKRKAKSRARKTVRRTIRRKAKTRTRKAKRRVAKRKARSRTRRTSRRKAPRRKAKRRSTRSGRRR